MKFAMFVFLAACLASTACNNESPSSNAQSNCSGDCTSTATKSDQLSDLDAKELNKMIGLDNHVGFCKTLHGAETIDDQSYVSCTTMLLNRKAGEQINIYGAVITETALDRAIKNINKDEPITNQSVLESLNGLVGSKNIDSPQSLCLALKSYVTDVRDIGLGDDVSCEDSLKRKFYYEIDRDAIDAKSFTPAHILLSLFLAPNEQFRYSKYIDPRFNPDSEAYRYSSVCVKYGTGSC